MINTNSHQSKFILLIVTTLCVGLIAIFLSQDKATANTGKGKPSHYTTHSVPVAQIRNAELNEKLANSRSNVIKDLQKIEKDLANWTLTDLGDLPQDIINKMESQEATSFNNILVYTHKELLEIGDLIPAILMNEAQDRAFIIWEKWDGSSAFVEARLEAGTEKWSMVSTNVKPTLKN